MNTTTFTDTMRSFVATLDDDTRAAFVGTVHAKMQTVLKGPPTGPLEDPLNAYLAGFHTSASLIEDGQRGAMLGAVIEVASWLYYEHGVRPDPRHTTDQRSDLVARAMSRLIMMGMINGD